MQLHFSVTFACCGNVEILVSTWCETEVVQILKMILGKNFWCADSPGLQVYKSASLQVYRSASLQVCKSASLQVCKSAVCKCRTPRLLRCCDRYITTAIKFIPLKALNTFTKASHKNQNGRSQPWRSARNSYSDSPCSRPKVYIWVSDTFA